MATTTQLDLDFCYWELRKHIARTDVTWGVVKNKALLAKIAIDQALNPGNIFSQWLVQTISEVTQSDEKAVNPLVTLRLANLVNAAIRMYDTKANTEPKS